MNDFNQLVPDTTSIQFSEDELRAAREMIDTPMGTPPKLFELRHEMPWVELMPFPHVVRTVLLPDSTSTPSPVEVSLPANCKVVRLKGSANYYAGLQEAQKPTVVYAENTGNNYEYAYSVSMFRPDDKLYWTEYVTKISLVSEGAGTVVSIECWLEVL